MPNALNEDKERVGYAEWSDVVSEIEKIAEELSKKEGREVTFTEAMRKITLGAVNRHRKLKGKPALPLDPESSVADRKHAG